jgi:peptidoglycan/xylan/chitin deacetylase (PgdA/CDA1 family)
LTLQLDRWSHPFLTELNKSAIITEMTRLEQAFDRILGFHPTYMRPPYLFTNDMVLSTMAELGYKVVTTDIDPEDWDHDSDNGVEISMAKFARELEEGGSIVLCHDVYVHTADFLVRRMVEWVKLKRLRAVTVAECLGETKEGWYNKTG